MEQCSICLEALDGGGVVALACNHRFHAACLAQMAGAVGTATTRRGSLTACPNCRTVSRVDTSTPVAAFSVGDRVSALWGHKFYPGVIDDVVDGGQSYEIVWDDGDEGRVLAKNVRRRPAASASARLEARAARRPTAAPARPPPRRAPPAPVRPAQRRPAVAPAPATAPEDEHAALSTAAPTPQQPCMRGKSSRFTGVAWRDIGGKWRAQISVRGTRVILGDFYDEEDAARAYDAALVKYKGKPTLNFPGEAPLASVLAALPDDYEASVLARTATAAPPHERSVATRRVIPEAPAMRGARREAGKPQGQKSIEMRRVGDRAWRWFESQTDAAKAFGVSQSDVSALVRNVKCASLRKTFEARPARRSPPKKRERPTKSKASAAPRKRAKFQGKSVEGATQKVNGKWACHDMFPGREFDDFDAFRAAKKQRYARRHEYRAQIPQHHRGGRKQQPPRIG